MTSKQFGSQGFNSGATQLDTPQQETRTTPRFGDTQVSEHWDGERWVETLQRWDGERFVNVR